MDKSPVSIRQCIENISQRFDQSDIYFGHGTDNALDETVHIVLWVLDLAWDELDSKIDQALQVEQYQKIVKLADRRIQERMPVAYLTGEAWFAGHKFDVDQRVLIPRSPIAELIERQFQPWLSEEPKRILDLCTGSGCIGIATAMVFPEAEVVLSDISPEALEVARQNIAYHRLQSRVDLCLSDGFDSLPKGHTFDLIVSNPPYVDAEDFASMPLEYHTEPALALASGRDGLDFVRPLLSQVQDYLSPKGLLIVEVGNSWVALEQAYPHLPFMWLEFEYGGHGVFALSKEELLAFSI